MIFRCFYIKLIAYRSKCQLCSKNIYKLSKFYQFCLALPRILFEYFSKTLRRLFEDSSKTIRRLFHCATYRALTDANGRKKIRNYNKRLSSHVSGVCLQTKTPKSKIESKFLKSTSSCRSARSIEESSSRMLPSLNFLLPSTVGLLLE